MRTWVRSWVAYLPHLRFGIAEILVARLTVTLTDTLLWLTDIDVLRAFDRRTGAPRGLIDLRPYGALLQVPSVILGRVEARHL